MPREHNRYENNILTGVARNRTLYNIHLMALFHCYYIWTMINLHNPHFSVPDTHLSNFKINPIVKEEKIKPLNQKLPPFRT